MKQKKIAWNEKFTMYLYVDWKMVPKVKSALISCGFEPDIKLRSDDDNEVSIEVTCENAGFVHQIIKSIIQ